MRREGDVSMPARLSQIEADKESKHMNKTNLKPLAWGLLALRIGGILLLLLEVMWES